MEELRSLLDNFKNLSKSEQMDLVQYMRKLETTDPEKVKRLKNFSSDKPADRYFFCPSSCNSTIVLYPLVSHVLSQA